VAVLREPGFVKSAANEKHRVGLCAECLLVANIALTLGTP